MAVENTPGLFEIPEFSAIPPTSSPEQYNLPDYDHFSVKPINGALGAELQGVDLSGPNEIGIFEEIGKALIHHKVVVIRDQNLSPALLVEIGRNFGEMHVNPFVQSIDNFPEVMPIRSEENHEKQFTGLWHSDISWSSKPSVGSLLYAVEVPAFGGDTLFANMCLAFSSLTPAMQKLLRGLKAEHRVDRYHASKPEYAEKPEDGVLHPVVTAHPVTGNNILFVNEYFTTRFEGVSEEKSAPLLKFLFQHSVRPDFTCRIQWQPGTLVFWDNRCTQHYATNDYPGQRRLMYRVTIDGDVPIPAK